MASQEQTARPRLRLERGKAEVPEEMQVIKTAVQRLASLTLIFLQVVA
jgi:hypothetical protein